MSKIYISTPEAPECEPGYSQAVRAGNTVYVHGTTGFNVATGEYAGPTVREQARQSLLNCQAILRAAGAELSDVVMVTTLLQRSQDATAVSEVSPTRTTATRRHTSALFACRPFGCGHEGT